MAAKKSDEVTTDSVEPVTGETPEKESTEFKEVRVRAEEVKPKFRTDTQTAKAEGRDVPDQIPDYHKKHPTLGKGNTPDVPSDPPQGPQG